MRIAGKAILVSGVAVLLAAAVVPVSARAATGGGITIAPAAITLKLRKGAADTTATFNVTNTYNTDVSLHFTFEKSQSNALAVDTARRQLSLTTEDLALAAGEKASQTVTLRDGAAIAPGSQSIDMVITQRSVPGQGVGVMPSLRLPVTIIKDDGAVTGLGLTNIAGPGIAMGLPSAVNITLHNTGNVVVIPRGVVTIESPGGAVLARGVLNEASAAVSPGADFTTAAKLTKLGSATLPGTYKIQLSYGLGGDAAAKTAGRQFVFIAWWHVLTLAMAMAVAWFIVTHRELLRLRSRHRKQPGPPKRVLAVRGHTT